MKLSADMGISPRTVEFLRDKGYEATHLHELALDLLTDAKILALGLQEGYVVLSHDLDFSELIAISRAELPSVVTFRLRDMRPANVNRHLAAILDQHVDKLTQGPAITVTDRRIRVRLLPIR
jgi:predicted nuclease of predicted toxin-antitoxin system